MSGRAVILAGGKGTRLRPYTVVFPKPLMPIGDYPILELIVRQLARAGFRHLTVAVNHQAELIEAFFGNGSKWGLRIDYSLEDEPLGTMGPLPLIRDLPENFLVMNGDILTDLDFAGFMRYHVERKGFFTIAAHTRTHRVDYGVLDVGLDGRLKAFSEKPSVNYVVSMGIYGVNRRVVERIPRGVTYGFDNLMNDFISSSVPIATMTHPGMWLDIGRPEDYTLALEMFEQNKERFVG